MKNRITALTGILLLATVLPAGFSARADSPPATNDIFEMPIDALLKVVITSVSKRPESLFGAPAAIYRVTDEDLKRSGFRNIADALRYVPGMQVAQINSHTWAVSTRGFNGEYATKLLVLMDGRSVYTPLSAGVYWDTVDLMLEDLDRVEVIRGPGGTLWGANAVNGVINIISKPAAETQGWLVTGGGGNLEQGFGGVRYGDKLGDSTYLRVYGKYDNHDDFPYFDGSSSHDSWDMGRAGFRLDSGDPSADLFTVQGDYYYGSESWQFTQPIPTAPFLENVTHTDQASGANLLGRWTHQFADESQFTAQTYYDHTYRESNLPQERRDTFDVDLQQHFAPTRRHNIVAGLGYRLTTDHIVGAFANSFVPDERTLNLFSAFLQDEITLYQDRLRLTLGSKLEHNDYTGFEVQPGVRLAWTPTDTQTFWGGISRAVRTPSRAEEDIRINRLASPLGAMATVWGDGDGDSEELVTYEIGYRAIPVKNLSFDVTAFYNMYDDLRDLEPGPPAPVTPPPAASFYVANKLTGQAWGFELSSDWKIATNWWRLRGSYTFYHLDLNFDHGGTDAGTIHLLEGCAPRHQFSLRSEMNLLENVSFDVGLRYVDPLNNPGIPAYTALDLRLAWQPSKRVEVALVGLNLLDPVHPEFAATQVITPQREVPRSVYGQVTLRF